MNRVKLLGCLMLPALAVALYGPAADAQEPAPDLEMGHSIVFQLRDADGDTELTDRAITVLKQRIDPDELRGVQFIQVDTGQVEIRLPPRAMEPRELIRLVASSGAVEFRVAPRRPEAARGHPASPLIDADEMARRVEALEKRGPAAETDATWAWRPVCDGVGSYRDQGLIAGEGPDGRGYVLLANEPEHSMTQRQAGGDAWSIDRVQATTDQQGMPAIEMQLDHRGGALMRRLSQANLHRPLAIVLDGVVYSAPIVRTTIGRDIMITGRFTAEEAGRLERILKAGTLPARIDPEPISQSSFEWPVSPSPGSRKTTSGSAGWLLPVALVAGGVLVLGALGYGVMRSRRRSV